MAGVAAIGFIAGAAQQVVNALTRSLPLPGVPQGDVLEPQGASQEAGAQFIDELLGRQPTRDAAQAAAAVQPGALVYAAVANVPAGTVVSLQFNAVAQGASWATPGRESGHLAVWVDGRYHSDVVVINERSGAYSVNLAGLALGAHRIELRQASVFAHSLPVAVSAAAVSATGPVDAEVQRHAPILEVDKRAADGRSPIASNDTPLVMVASVKRHNDGSRTISYSVLFSNEDGGTATDDLFRRWGRGTDYELVYQVTLGASGERLLERYQGPRHQMHDFSGQRVDGRPVLRVATANNNFSQRLYAGSRRWSAAPVLMRRADDSPLQVMLQHPWTFTVMGAELHREGKAGGSATQTAHDARAFLYLSNLPEAVTTALRAGRAIAVKLRDGSKVAVSAAMVEHRNGDLALVLPAELGAELITGVEGLPRGVMAFVLDGRFQPRVLQELA